MLGKSSPYGFITITRKNGKQLTQELYELEEVGGEKMFTEDGMTKVRYKKSNRLGLTNNFIEYDANSRIETSYFEDIRNESADDMDDEQMSQEQSRDEQELPQSNVPSDADDTSNSLWILARREMLKFHDNKYLKELKKVYQQGTNSELATAFKDLLQAKEEDKKSIMERIEKIFKEQNKC